MKSIICVVLVAGLVGVNALTEEQLKKADGFATTCLAKSNGVTKDSVGKLRGGDFANVDQDLKCFTKCFLEQAGFMSADGQLVQGYAVERLSQDREKGKVESLVQKCSVQKDDPCETAFRAFECYYNGKAALL
ncbi:general odorant-binding protein 56d-like [Armigeres subalbatus]|uniref:general odorant-binding protein 56d-like n=1 Tax=Armigeres subalbatus TaxID=124917 RepID=UPI002ED32443